MKFKIAAKVFVFLLMASGMFIFLKPDDSPKFASDDYLGPCHAQVWDSNFWIDTHPFGIKVIYKLLGRDPEVIIVGQRAMLSLAVAFMTVRLAAIAPVIWPVIAALCLGLGLWHPISHWTIWMLSESASISLFLVWATLIAGRSRWSVIAAIPLALVRDSNVIFLTITVVSYRMFGISHWSAVACGLTLVVIIGLQVAGNRGQPGVVNNTCNRVIPEGGKTTGLDAPERYVGKIYKTAGPGMTAWAEDKGFRS